MNFKEDVSRSIRQKRTTEEKDVRTRCPTSMYVEGEVERRGREVPL